MKRILVADDDRTTRMLVSEILKTGKYTVVTSADGADALKKLKTNKFDLTLLDVWMPRMNGLEVLAALRKTKAKPKVIVMTSDDTPETLLGAIREQAFQYIAKPIEPQSLLALVRESLAKSGEPLPIEVVSARPEWVELVVPCTLETAQRHNRERAEADRQARQRAREALDTLADIRSHEAELARAAAAVVSRRAALEEAAQRLMLDRREAEAETEAARGALAALPDPTVGRDEIQAARSALAERRALQQAHQGERDRLVREAATRSERLAAIGVELQSWEQRADAAARQRQTLESRRGELSAEIESLAQRPQAIAIERDRLAETIAASTTRRNQAADALAAGEGKLGEADKAARAAEASAGEAREERVRAEGVRDQAVLARTTVADAIAEKLQAKPDGVLAAAGIEPDEELPEIGAATTRLDRLLRERENMGPVNLVAEAESREIEERLNGLNREREDLVGAIAKLRQGITALNREGRERLLAAFTQVNDHFGKLFARLFGGGNAHLRLDPGEDDDPLQAGLEIMASPPGKKLQNLTLLSGGEQALTALALLFAVFLTNPAPICVLDEVDAPLDDANVDRFCRLVAEIAESAETRFLIITHHRLTMARVDRLYGVTMGEKGVSQLVSVDLQGVEQLRRTA